MSSVGKSAKSQATTRIAVAVVDQGNEAAVAAARPSAIRVSPARSMALVAGALMAESVIAHPQIDRSAPDQLT
jgi:hypothetical protein